MIAILTDYIARKKEKINLMRMEIV